METMTIGGREYLLIVIYEGNQDDISQEFLAMAQEWVINQYKGRGRITDPNVLKELRQTETVLDSHSSMVIITERANIENIQGTLRVSTESEGELPLEKRLRISLKRPILNNGGKVFDPPGLSDSFGGPEGTLVELKNFVISGNAKEDFIPLLYWLAETSGVTREVFKNGKAFYPVLPARYVLECDKPMSIYYRRLGFILKQVVGDTYVMEIDRLGFRDIYDKVAKRPGFTLYSRAKHFNPIDPEIRQYRRLGYLPPYWGAFDGKYEARKTMEREMEIISEKFKRKKKLQTMPNCMTLELQNLIH
ncbi:MAG: hypothetical protein AABZ06_02055 [Bdellovibrionota bacterium]